MNASSRTMIRAATHLDVDAIAVDRALDVLQDLMRNMVRREGGAESR
jgi:hypothetical protein